MSFEAMTWAVKKQLPYKEKLVLLMLANRTNQDTGRCNPSHRRLADDCGMSESSVKRAISVLCDAGLVKVDQQYVADSQLPNHYILDLENPGQPDPPLFKVKFDRGSDRPTKQRILLNHEDREIPQKQTFNLKTMIDELPEGLSEEALRDYVKFKSKKGPMTRRMWNAVVKELGILRQRGFNLDDALLHAQMKGWQGLDNTWFKDQPGQPIAVASAPLQALLDLYHQHCPLMERALLTESLAAAMTERWREEPDLEGWELFFRHCGKKFGAEGTVNWFGDRKRPYLALLVSKELFGTL